MVELEENFRFPAGKYKESIALLLLPFLLNSRNLPSKKLFVGC